MGAPQLVDEPLADATGADASSGVERSRWSVALKLAGLAAVTGTLGLLVWATLASGQGTSLVARIAAGKKPPAPSFDLGVIWPRTETWPPSLRAAIADGKLDLSELRGRRVVLNFWASWCIPCRQEAPILHASALRHRGRVAFVGINVRDLTDDALGFARKYKVNYVSVRDGSGDKTWNSYGLTGVPETYFINDGRIVAHIPGAISAQTLEQGIAAITRVSRGGTLPGGAHVTP